MKREQRSNNVFDNDDLDEAVTAADDTGMIAAEHLITEESILEATEPEEGADEDETSRP